MADNNLEITLSLNDQATAPAADALKKIGVTADQTGAKGAAAGNAFNNGFKEAHKELRSFHQDLGTILFTTLAFTTAINAWGSENQNTRDSLESMAVSSQKLTALLGSALGPTIKGIADGLIFILKPIEYVVQGFEKIYTSFYKVYSFASQFGIAFATSLKAGSSASDAFKDSMEIAGRAAKEMGDSFAKTFTVTDPYIIEANEKLKEMTASLNNFNVLLKSGLTNAIGFYAGITQQQFALLQVNTAAAQQLTQLANLSREVSNTSMLNAQRQTNEQISLLNEYKSAFMTANAGMAAFTVTVSKSIQTNLSGALTDVITGAKSAKQAFMDLGEALLKTVVDFMTQKLVAFALEKTLLAGTVAASVAAGSAVASAWAAAAAFASLATLGGNAAPASAALISTTGVALALAVPKGFAEGTDTVPAMLSPGEMVFPRSMADAIRAGQISVSGPGHSGEAGDVNIYLYNPQFKNQSDARQYSELIGYEIQRKLRGARSNL